MVWKERLRRTEGTNSPWITLKMKFTWSFNEIRDKPSSNGIWHRSSQRRPKLTLRLPLTRASRYRITSDRWDVVWEIKYWGLQTINIIIFYLLTLLLLINKPNKEYSSLLYFFVFRNEFIDLVLFLARLLYPRYFTCERSYRWINTETHKYNKDEYSLIRLLIKRWNITIFIVRRPQYSISHGQRLNDRL